MSGYFSTNENNRTSAVFIHSFRHIQTESSSVAIRRGSSPFTHRWSAQLEKRSWDAEPNVELGPAIQQADAL